MILTPFSSGGFMRWGPLGACPPPVAKKNCQEFIMISSFGDDEASMVFNHQSI